MYCAENATIKFLINTKIQTMRRSLISTAIKQAIAIDPVAEMSIKEIIRQMCIIKRFGHALCV